MSWGVLGAPRLHCTIATGAVVPKEAAGQYALDTFDRSWHPIIGEALAYRRGEPVDAALQGPAARIRAAGEFVLEVAESADRLA